MNTSQHGFTQKRSCLTNLFVTFEMITKAIDEGDNVNLIWFWRMPPTHGGTVTEESSLLYKQHLPLLPPAMGARFTVFWARQPHVLTKAGDVKTNPEATNTQI